MAGRHTISKGETFSGLEKRYNLPYGSIAKANPGVNPNRLRIGSVVNMPKIPEPVIQAAPGRLPVDLIKFSQAISHAETGGERNPYIRTRFGNSTAYGPQQMTGTLVRDYYNRHPDIKKNYGKFIESRLFPMYNKFRLFGRAPNKPGYHKRYDYGGTGDPLTDDEKLQYNDLAAAIMRKNFEEAMKSGNTSKDALLRAGIQRWRGVPYEQDPRYYDKVMNFYNNGK